MKKTEIYRNAIDRFENVIGIFEGELEPPEPLHASFIYKSPTLKTICFLKSVRIVSGLNALLVLLEAGYVTEMGVLVRTIGDCINDIYFILENFPDATPEVEKYVSYFFNEGIEEPQIIPEQEKKIYRTKARKIHASRARLLSEHINFPVGRDMVYNIYSSYSGYVHAGYPHTMEMYGGPKPHKFHLQGMKGTSRIQEWEKVFAAFIRSTILVFGYMAEKYERTDIVEEIREIMDWFDKETMRMETET